MKKASINIKKIICLLLVSLIYIYNSVYPCLAQDTIYKARVSDSNLKELFLKLVPDTLIDTDLSMPGDFFSVMVTKPSAQLLQIPTGSRLIGKVTEIEEAKSFNRGAKLKSEIDQIMLPDGHLVKAHAILSAEAAMQNMDKPSSTKKIVNAITQNSKEITASALVGAVDSLEYLGINTAIASSGISTAIGAGIGFGMGLYGAFTQEGQELNYNQFNAMSFKLESEFELLEELPYSQTELEDLIDISILGIDLDITKVQKHFSRQYGDFLLIKMQVKNHSQEKLCLGDFVLASDLHIKPVLANPLLSAQSILSIMPNTETEVTLAFSLSKFKKNENYKIYLLNAIDQTIMANTNIEIAEFI